MAMLGGSCSPCCRTIGFDSEASFLECFPDFSVFTNIKDDVAKLSGLKLVLAGYQTDGTCETQVSVRFNSTDYEAVKDWIESGGRLVVFSEFETCMQDSATLTTFLGALGSTMSWVGTLVDGGCHDLSASPPRDRRCTAGDANIAQGLNGDIYMAAAGEISGGTSIFFSPSGTLIFAVEKLGNGFLFFCGDSSMQPDNCDGLHESNCEFFGRLYDYADGDII
jgi:hypothetical protein